jgi:nitrile hydratase
MVIPRRPTRTEGLSESELAGLVTRNGLISTAPV